MYSLERPEQNVNDKTAAQKVMSFTIVLSRSTGILLNLSNRYTENNFIGILKADILHRKCWWSTTPKGKCDQGGCL